MCGVCVCVCVCVCVNNKHCPVCFSLENRYSSVCVCVCVNNKVTQPLLAHSGVLIKFGWV